MLFAAIALAALPDLVPARWMSNDPASLDLLRGTPVNCVLVEQAQWSQPFNEAASKRGVVTMAVIRPEADLLASAHRAIELRFGGAVLEGSFAAARKPDLVKALSDAKLPIIELTPRTEMKFDPSAQVVGTDQGVWPGIQIEEDGKAKAAPSGAAWIDTNSGFLRYVRASTEAAVWIANQPPQKQVFSADRYIQAIADANMVGARWVLSFDEEFTKRLLNGDKQTLAGWARISKVLEFYEAHPEWRRGQPYARLALVQDESTGALLSGGILDMIATKHTPVRTVPKERLNDQALNEIRMAVNVDPESLTPPQRETLKAFTRAGGTLLTGPPGWKFPAPRPGQITLEKDDLKKLDEIWREMNALTGRKNLGARLFNVSSMLSNLLELSGNKQVLIHLVNYSDFPVENVTLHVLGSYKTANLLRPEAPSNAVTGYDVEEGTGFDLDQVRSVATLVLTKNQ